MKPIILVIVLVVICAVTSASAAVDGGFDMTRFEVFQCDQLVMPLFIGPITFGFTMDWGFVWLATTDGDEDGGDDGSDDGKGGDDPPPPPPPPEERTWGYVKALYQ